MYPLKKIMICAHHKLYLVIIKVNASTILVNVMLNAISNQHL